MSELGRLFPRPVGKMRDARLEHLKGARAIERRRGMTLLEALVALAILGAGFGAILDLQAQLVRGLEAVERSHQRAAWRLNAIEIAASIERDEQRQGQISWPNGSHLEWAPVTGRAWVKPNRIGQRQRGSWRVTLAPIEITVYQDGAPVFRGEQLALSVVRADQTAP